MESNPRVRTGPAGRRFALGLGALVGAIVAASAAPGADAPSAPGPITASVTHSNEWCGMEPAARIWEERHGLRDRGLRDRYCATQGDCDVPAIRNATETFPLTVSVIFHVMRDHDGTGGPSQEAVDGTIARMNADFASYGFQFVNLATLFHDDSTYFCVPAYHPDSTDWYDTIEAMKVQYAQTPDLAVNIFASCIEESPPDTLWGYGHFPWWSTALGPEGGIWLNSDFAVGAEYRTATHEIGHNLGLWHTFRGVSEVPTECIGCYEFASGYQGNRLGDYCKDTPPTPINWTCAPPGGEDCEGTPWGETLYRNHMGYGPEDCTDAFTFHQQLRMHCWTKDRLMSWITDPPTEVGRVATAADLPFHLSVSHPNPFTGYTTVSYALTRRGRVRLTVHDVRGREVSTLVDAVQNEGSRSVTWDGRDEAENLLPSGVYFWRLRANDQVETRKVVRVTR